MNPNNSFLFPEIETFIRELNPDSISQERKEILQPLLDYIQEKASTHQQIRLNFICTHNSRRSHLTQIWAQTMAYYFDIKDVFCYSGGTESTAIYPMVATTLANTGFAIFALSEGKNPIYSVKFANNHHPIIAFSKKLDSDFNPEAEFAAIMTCSQADGGCPFIIGAEKRIPITYDDPKAFDNTPVQSEKYHERSVQIATELLFIFSQIKV
ncbi:low molecular weight phosphatase family protein [Flavobacterium sp. SM2513]|uniref:arsenate-mycothiol transferase ArsC n=1 Tax=Flavobacterium sp. SM2513 TaxID=3424766 RepID=UPI003D7FAF8A